MRVETVADGKLPRWQCPNRKCNNVVAINPATYAAWLAKQTPRA